MHVPQDSLAETLRSMVIPLCVEAPLMVGLWGGERGEVIDEARIGGERRIFYLRSFRDNRQLMAEAGSVDQASRWEVGPDGWEYQVFLLRTNEPSP